MAPNWWRSLLETVAILWTATVDTLRAYWDVARELPTSIWVLLGIGIVLVALASRR